MPALDVDDLIKDTSTTTGTGATKTLANSAPTGHQTFNAGIGVGPRFPYRQYNAAGTEWEVGIGHLTDEDTLVRDEVLSSSNSNVAVDFTGTTTLICTLPAKLFKDLVTPPINAQTGTTYTLLDTDNGKVITFSNSSNITVTIPADLGAGFHCICMPIGDGDIVFDESGTTVNGDSTDINIIAYQQYTEVQVRAYAANTFAVGPPNLLTTTPRFVQQKSGYDSDISSGSLTITLDAPATAGNVLVVIPAYPAAGGTYLSWGITVEGNDASGALQASIGEVFGDGYIIRPLIYTCVGGEDTIVFEGYESGHEMAVHVSEWSYLDALQYHNADSINAGTDRTSWDLSTGGALAAFIAQSPPYILELWFATFVDDEYVSHTGGFTAFTTSGGGNIWLEGGYKIVKLEDADGPVLTTTSVQGLAVLIQFYGSDDRGIIGIP